MSTLSDLAEGMSGTATFLTSAIGTGLIGIALAYPRSCTGGSLSEGVLATCENVFGTTTMTPEAAGVAGTVIGFVVGFLVLGLRELILHHEQSQGGAT
jgi:hypothetical protein